MKSLPIAQASGPDGLSNRVLRELSKELSVPYCSLFNQSLRVGTVPSSYKEANVCPVPKAGDLSQVSSYRPISLLNSENKVLERLVFKYLFNHLRDNNLLSSLQSGFLPGDSTVNQLTFLYNTLCHALDSGKEVRAVFCDISKAFDRVWHAGPLAKLHAAGVTGNVHAWFADYLSNRKQLVVLPGAVSDWASTHAGVPQGSILGPLLFILYINDFVHDIGSNIRLFADDTSLYIIVDDPVTAAGCINTDLVRISKWALAFLLDNIYIYIRFGAKLYRQIVGIPMGTNCAPLVADLFLFCYERDLMLSLSDDNQSGVIEAFNSTSRYLDDLLNIDNNFFDSMVNPSELQLNKANVSDAEASFLDLHLSISDGFVKTKIYDKRDDFDFDVVNFPFLDGDVPRSASYGVYISQLIRFARVSSHVDDFNTRNKVLTAKLLRQGYSYHKLRKAFSKFYRRHLDIVSKYNVGLKTLLLQGLSEPEFYGDLVYKFRKIIGKNDFPYHFKKIIVRYKRLVIT